MNALVNDNSTKGYFVIFSFELFKFHSSFHFTLPFPSLCFTNKINHKRRSLIYLSILHYPFKMWEQFLCCISILFLIFIFHWFPFIYSRFYRSQEYSFLYLPFITLVVPSISEIIHQKVWISFVSQIKNKRIEHEWPPCVMFSSPKGKYQRCGTAQPAVPHSCRFAGTGQEAKLNKKR